MNYYFDKTRNIIIAIINYSYDYYWAIIGKNSIFIKELFNINLALIQLLKF